jgi:endonuclease G
MSAKRKKAKQKNLLRAWSTKVGLALFMLLFLFSAIGSWFVHHPRQWLEEKAESWPGLATKVLYYFGNPAGDILDAAGITGHDAVYEYDLPAPERSVFFAGAPKRVGLPAPNDIKIIDRGDFVVGWSSSLRHAVWCAYHVIPGTNYPENDRPNFQQDKSVQNAAKPGDYAKTGYDRGHMVPNHAIVTRYGIEAQKKTFLMSNIVPQSPSLNRGAWREFEHRIADLWTKKWGEIWVIVGCYSDITDRQVLPGTTDIDVPERFYQIIIAQEGMNVRALAIDMPQDTPYGAYPSRHITTIDAIEESSGLDFFPELPGFIQSPIEAELPTRLWPCRLIDIFKMLRLHFKY